jgi:hypothetical protein
MDDHSVSAPRNSSGDACSSSSNPLPQRHLLYTLFWWGDFAGIIIIGFFIRAQTLYFPHDHGDQIIYTALADNIQHGRDYNLSCVAITSMACRVPDIRLLGFLPAQSSTQSVAWLFMSGGADIYRDPLFFRVPLFPIAINGCRKLTGSQSIRLISLTGMRTSGSPADYYFRWYSSLDPGLYAAVAAPQLPAILPPLLFSILIIGFTMLWARQYSPAAALWAGLIIALCPVDIFAAGRIYPDSMMTALMLVSILMLTTACMKQNTTSIGTITRYVIAVISGIAAAYTKESALCLLFFTALVMSLNKLCRRACLIYCICLVISFLPWIWLMHIYNGRWLPLAHWITPASAYWYSVTSRRSALFHILQPVILCPVFLFGLAWFLSLFSRKKWWLDTGFLVIIITVSMATCMKAYESRQILPVYPFLATAAAWGLEQWRRYISRRFQPVAGYAAVLLVIGLSTGWGLYIAYASLMGNAGDIFVK